VAKMLIQILMVTDWQYQIAASKKNEADGGYVSATVLCVT